MGLQMCRAQQGPNGDMMMAFVNNPSSLQVQFHGLWNITNVKSVVVRTGYNHNQPSTYNNEHKQRALCPAKYGCFSPSSLSRQLISIQSLTCRSNQEILPPDKRVPVVLLMATGICSRPLLNLEWLEVILGVLTLVAFFQVFTYKIVFSDNAFQIIRGNKIVRNYPYMEWLSWRFLPSTNFPILLYFREYSERRESQGGPLTRWHLLPVLYNPSGFVKYLQAHQNISKSISDSDKKKQ